MCLIEVARAGDGEACGLQGIGDEAPSPTSTTCRTSVVDLHLAQLADDRVGVVAAGRLDRASR
jgi:hypothetical protein